MDNKRFGSRILTLRALKGLSQQELADALGISRATLSMIENGKVLPSDETRVALERVLGIRFEDEAINEAFKVLSGNTSES